jgi:hypothetical protein
MGTLAQPANGAYSLSFFDRGPSAGPADRVGTALRGAVFFGPEHTACEGYSRHLDAGEPADFWVLRWTVSDAKPGTYAIVVNVPFPAPSAMASARLERWHGGREAERLTAETGTITIASAAFTPQDWPMASDLVGVAELGLPDPSIQSLGCSGTMSDGAALSQCECMDARTGPFTCAKSPDAPDCCLAQSASAHDVRISLDGAACAAMCQTSATFNCAALRGG